MTETVHSDFVPWHRRRLVKWLRDSALVLLLFWGINEWQTRHMLQTDGSVQVQATQLAGLDGEVHRIFDVPADNKPTLVYFFAPWCKVCEMSIGNLNELDESKINIVRVALDYRHIEAVGEFIDKTRSEGPILLGTNKIKQDFRVPGYPSYYLLDNDKRVIGRAMGYSTEWGMKLKSYLANQTAS